MDNIVKQALAKWPNVPHCRGWLKLDARGHWRMCDERAQHFKLAGDVIHHEALKAFINRNYTTDDFVEWYFQNGPQRVYVTYEATPYIAQLNAEGIWQFHTQDLSPTPSQIQLTTEGHLVFAYSQFQAQVDDRDLAQALQLITRHGLPLSEMQLNDLWEQRLLTSAPTSTPYQMQWPLSTHQTLIPLVFK